MSTDNDLRARVDAVLRYLDGYWITVPATAMGGSQAAVIRALLTTPTRVPSGSTDTEEQQP